MHARAHTLLHSHSHIHSLTDSHRIGVNLLSLVRIIYVCYFYVLWKNKVHAELLLIYIFLSAIPPPSLCVERLPENH